MPRIVCSWCLLLMCFPFLFPPFLKTLNILLLSSCAHFFPYPVVVNSTGGMSYILLHGTVWRHEDAKSFGEEHLFSRVTTQCESSNTALMSPRSVWSTWILLLISLSGNNRIWTDTACAPSGKVKLLSRCYFL